MTKTKTVLILGGDGYLGWSLSLAFAARTDDQIVIVDNLVKREWEGFVGAQTLVKLESIDKRLKEYRRIFKKNNLSFVKVDLKNYNAVLELIARYRPATIINAAQQPSAPFSMLNAHCANATLENNTKTNLNVLWAIATIDKNIKYIKLGSAGTYLGVDCDFIPKTKVDLEFTTTGGRKKILNSWLPMQAGDFYHQSKAFSFLLSDLCCRLWGLKVITVQQSIIFGATISENRDASHHSLATRFNYDHIFGTVMNRFVCQAAINQALTVYGDGQQRTVFISLRDTVDNFLRLANLDIVPGEHFVEHNYTHSFSIFEVANILLKIKPGQIKAIKNPRTEIKPQLRKEFAPSELLSANLKSENHFIESLSELLSFAMLYRDNINKDIIMPKVSWQK